MRMLDAGEDGVKCLFEGNLQVAHKLFICLTTYSMALSPIEPEFV